MLIISCVNVWVRCSFPEYVLGRKHMFVLGLCCLLRSHQVVDFLPSRLAHPSFQMFLKIASGGYASLERKTGTPAQHSKALEITRKIKKEIFMVAVFVICSLLHFLFFILNKKIQSAWGEGPPPSKKYKYYVFNWALFNFYVLIQM